MAFKGNSLESHYLCKITIKSAIFIWWRRGESNPCPKVHR